MGGGRDPQSGTGNRQGPGAVLVDERIEQDDQFAEAGDEGDALGLPGVEEALIESAERWVVPDGGQCRGSAPG